MLFLIKEKALQKRLDADGTVCLETESRVQEKSGFQNRDHQLVSQLNQGRGSMRIDFNFSEDEMFTATVTRHGGGFNAICCNVTSRGETVNESIDNLRNHMKRHFLKMRCKNAITANPRARL